MVGVPFQKGFDSRRHTKGTTPSKGKRALYTEKVIDTYQNDIFHLIGMEIARAKDESIPYEKRESSIDRSIKFGERFLTKPSSETPSEDDNLTLEKSELSKLSLKAIADIKEIVRLDMEVKSNNKGQAEEI